MRKSNWTYLSSMATYLDGLTALGETALVEAEARRVIQPETYLEPFALRAVGMVHGDLRLVERAVARFEAFGLKWHATRTRALL